MTTKIPEIRIEDVDTRRSGGISVQFGDLILTASSGSRIVECKALICPEEDGGFSSFALRLPGVGSQGESFGEAVTNLADAFRGALISYSELGMPIPWEDVDIERTPGSQERWITVDVR